MSESYLDIDGDSIFVRHNTIRSGRPTVLLVHGLGDSGLAYKEAFGYDLVHNYNILVPDLIGYGRSSAAISGDYGFQRQTAVLWKVIEHFQTSDLAVVGHSMGGDITTLLCASDTKNIVKTYVNVEGDVTEHDLFISGRVVKAAENGDFEKWFAEDFLEATVFEKWGKKLKSTRRYYASLQFCRPEAFLANCRELVARNTALTGKIKSEIGKIYCSLNIPKVFCYGTRSLPSGVVNFLKENNLSCRVFQDTAHLIMTERPDEFYSFLEEFISGTTRQD